MVFCNHWLVLMFIVLYRTCFGRFIGFGSFNNGGFVVFSDFSGDSYFCGLLKVRFLRLNLVVVGRMNLSRLLFLRILCQTDD